ncbi:IclR family transcriptional regulator [Peribacillus cavernae]|uniref:IclR family transcriptional regulator n=1 Tax=Peribacillus cavernae TaxID=1674310 RepID=A0A3S0VFU2_9BACI|nr:IclR family transcriptional regulator [Peribacillus cavernae]MDQ0219444.1 DNA-binding IclR family transcriptional regulator [Peribacillus cavernae]RUQ27133.1 IclR family transcriptional regulator [Peribacillus cavernae]
MPKTEDNKYMIPSVDSAARILQYLSSYRHSHGSVTEISQALSINRSTCYRILFTLEKNNLVTFHEDKKVYSLGAYMAVLGNRAAELVDYLPIAKEYLKQASKLTNHACVLVERFGENRLIYIAKEESPAPVTVTLKEGQSFPLTAGSHGKCFLAFMDFMERESIIKQIGLTQFTDKTISQKEQFYKELDKVREHGYAISMEEHYPTLFGVASPVLDSSNKAVMTMSCIGMSSMVTMEQVHEYGSILGNLTKELSSRLYGVAQYSTL